MIVVSLLVSRNARISPLGGKFLNEYRRKLSGKRVLGVYARVSPEEMTCCGS